MLCCHGQAATLTMRLLPMIESPRPNNCVQATPDYALLFVIAQVSGAPDAERWARHETKCTLGHLRTPP